MDDRDRDRDRMDGRRMWVPWAAASFALVFVAFLALAFGMRAFPPDGDHSWHGWHFGPGIFFGIFVMFLMFGMFRRMHWWGYYPSERLWRYRRYFRDPYEDEREFEEWHRRAHDRMDRMDGRGRSSAPGADAGNGGSSRRD